MSNRYEDTGKQRANETTTPESKYPYNQVYQTAGGIRVIVGNEPGKETLKIFHPSGSYMEMMPNGKTVSMSIGENKQYNKGGVTITVDENQDVHIKGHSKLQVGGGSHIEVAGDAGIVVGGSVAMSMPKGDLGIQAKNIYMGATGNFNLNVEGDSTINTKGTTSIKSEGAINIDSDTGVTQKAPTSTIDSPTIELKGDITHTGDMTTSGIHTDSLGPHTA